MDQLLRIAIANLQTGIGTTRGYWHYLTTAWKYRLPHDSRPIEQAARFLREARIDVAALCEIEAGSRRTRGVDQLALLGDIAGMPSRSFFPTRVVGARVNQGNALASPHPLRPVANHPLPGVGEPRFLSEGELDFNGRPIRVLVTHLSLEHKLRTPQIHRIARLVNRSSGPTILAGDFNIAESAELSLLRESILDRAIGGATFPAWGPRKSLDHLFFSVHFEFRRSYVYDGELFSDHLPLVAEVRLRDPGVTPPKVNEVLPPAEPWGG